MVTADVDVLADKGLPELSHPVDGSVPLVGLDDLSGQLRVTDSPQRRGPGLVVVVGGRGELQGLADRLDPEPLPVSVDERSYFGCRRSSSAPKKIAADFHLIRPAQLAVLLFELAHVSSLVGAEPDAVPLVDLGLVDPFAERLDIEAKLVRDLADRTPLFSGLSPDLEHEADRSLPQLSWVLPRCWHDSILSKE
jgi:hypothetical protein